MIDNSIYDRLGERWYTAWDDPVALLRTENEAKWPWIMEKIAEFFPQANTVLDVGCGAGFLSNRLAKEGFEVTGVDLSTESLEVASRYDSTGTVRYEKANAYELPFFEKSFDVVTCMDFLEHVDNPQKVIAECARVLRPGGIFFYHTFNRSALSEAVIIKFVERFVRNTPPRMHVIELFLRPEEVLDYCRKAELTNLDLTGLRPKLGSFSPLDIFRGIVPKTLAFTPTPSLALSYLGAARKE